MEGIPAGMERSQLPRYLAQAIAGDATHAPVAPRSLAWGMTGTNSGTPARDLLENLAWRNLIQGGDFVVLAISRRPPAGRRALPVCVPRARHHAVLYL